MRITSIPFAVTDWSAIRKVAHQGESGTAFWQTLQFGSLRVRMVEYSPGYLADSWCERGHILLCLAGVLLTELEDRRRFRLEPGQSFQIADGDEPHRLSTEVGAKVFIVD